MPLACGGLRSTVSRLLDGLVLVKMKLKAESNPLFHSAAIGGFGDVR